MENIFQSRTTILRDYEFPLSTKDHFIVKAKTSGIGFKNKFSHLLEGVIDAAEFDKTLTDVRFNLIQ